MSRPVRRTRRAFAAAVVLCALGGAVAAAPASASPVPPQTQVVGGSPAATGQFPYLAGILLTASDGQYQCGGTVISPSWVLTAAHCVYDETTGALLPPGAFQVRTGSLNFSSGGKVYAVAQVVPRSDFTFDTFAGDAALLRLSKPTAASPVTLIGSGSGDAALDDPGVVATTAGWGVTSESASAGSETLRYVDVPIQTDATCHGDYPAGADYGEYLAASMLCAGPLAGGKDSCFGDSGGPLLVPAGGGVRQAGVVSWGDGCARANRPGIYTRLTTYTDWVGRVRRFGPFGDSTAYITQNFLDFVDRRPTSSELNTWRTNLNTQAPQSLPVALESSKAWKDAAWANIRLYQAAFLRDPDTSGLTYWVDRKFQGDTLSKIAAKYAGTAEFRNRYDSKTNGEYVDAIYENVFGRAPDQGGHDYWTGKLDSGTSRSDVLVGFAQSVEFQNKTNDRTLLISSWFGMLRRVPNAGEISAHLGQGADPLLNYLRKTFSYANRF